MGPEPPIAAIDGASVDDTERLERTHQLFYDFERCLDRDRRQLLCDEIASLHLGLAHRLAARYRRRGVPDDDLRQVACLGLMKAIHGFRPDLGGEFTSYAAPTILGEIKRYFRDKCWTVKPTRRVQELQSRVISVVGELEQQLGREPTISEVAQHLDETTEAVGEAMTAGSCYAPRSLDARLESDVETSFLAIVGDEDPEFERTEWHHVLAEAISGLSERDRQIVGLRFFDDLTQRQIADRIGVTQMQVSRLLSRIMTGLRAELAGVETASGHGRAQPVG